MYTRHSSAVVPVICMMKRNEFVSENHFRIVFLVSVWWGGFVVPCAESSALPLKPRRVQYCVFMHAHLPLAHLNVCDVSNELPELLRHNNARGRDEMDSLLGVTILPLLSWLPRCWSPACCSSLHEPNEPVRFNMHSPFTIGSWVKKNQAQIHHLRGFR